MGDDAASDFCHKYELPSMFPAGEVGQEQGRMPESQQDEEQTEAGIGDGHDDFEGWATLTAALNGLLHTQIPEHARPRVVKALDSLDRLGFPTRPEHQTLLATRTLATVPLLWDEVSHATADQPRPHTHVPHFEPPPETRLSYEVFARLATQYEKSHTHAAPEGRHAQPYNEREGQPSNIQYGSNDVHTATFGERLRDLQMPQSNVGRNQTPPQTDDQPREHTQSFSDYLTSIDWDLLEGRDDTSMFQPTGLPATPSGEPVNTGDAETDILSLHSEAPDAIHPGPPVQPAQPTQPVQHVPVGVRYACAWPDCQAEGKSWATPGGLNKHLKNCHTPEESKRFKCDVCSKRFVWDNHLRRHLSSHTDECLFECGHCNHAFTRSDNLQRHCRESCMVIELSSPSSSASKKRCRSARSSRASLPSVAEGVEAEVVERQGLIGHHFAGPSNFQAGGVRALVDDMAIDDNI
ncbi:uncharacterized protein LTR77_007940 [Saxophila tyrrhenica]|uniref:C2H2 type master regulator of conidiophore development brlA n=1 Tax=Saxophila tyrrhenica TaxID=1690608 RepID=A0AAV9P3J9_9PEZI|nr:hypothetical protein LTR77_007940 [Saxophila tyrrhenica]